MEKEEFISRLTTDLRYVASVAEQLIVRPTALREVIKDETIKKKLIDENPEPKPQF